MSDCLTFYSAQQPNSPVSVPVRYKVWVCAASRLLRSWVRIPPGAWVSVCCECCVLSGRDICDGLITRPEESYRLWCVVECDLETSLIKRPWPTGGCCAKKKPNSGLGCLFVEGSKTYTVRNTHPLGLL